MKQKLKNHGNIEYQNLIQIIKVQKKIINFH